MKTLDAIAVFTADRPHLAQRCAESYFTNHSHPREFLLMDDSRQQTPSVISDLAAHLTGTCGVTTRYADRASRQDYISHLVRLGIPPDVATFAVLGDPCGSFTAGANRNAALLDSIGGQLLMADDDTVATTAVPIPAATDLFIAGHYDPSDVHFFPTGAARHAANWSPVDLVTEIANLLGSPVSQLNGCGCVPAADATLRMATCGVVGDSGYFSPSHLLWLGPRPLYEKLRPSEELLNTAFSSRDVIRMAPRLIVAHKTVCMATTLGLDHSQMLPPFLPIARNEDGFFGKLMMRLFPAACTAFLPRAVLHDPPGAREYNRLPHQPQSVRISELLMLLMSGCHTNSLDALGRFFVEISGDGLEPHARDTVRKSRSALFRLIRHRHATAFAPATNAWLQQANLLRSSLAEFIRSPECWLPSDLPAPEVGRIIRMTGLLLIHWPEILDAARRLAVDGVRVTRLPAANS